MLLCEGKFSTTVHNFTALKLEPAIKINKNIDNDNVPPLIIIMTLTRHHHEYSYI